MGGDELLLNAARLSHELNALYQLWGRFSVLAAQDDERGTHKLGCRGHDGDRHDEQQDARKGTDLRVDLLEVLFLMLHFERRIRGDRQRVALARRVVQEDA